MWTINNRFVVQEKETPRQGGMAEVWPAVDVENPGSRVAIKLFSEGFVHTNVMLEAFSRETRSLIELSTHPNVARLLDCGTDETTSKKYIALEWLESDLTDHLCRNPVKGWDEFFEKYGRPILKALCFAQSRGIVHRDVKPANVLMSSEGEVRVSDFGISKFKEYYGPGITLAEYASPPYAPPEREIGPFIDTKDVYGFAVLCLEMMSVGELEPEADVPALMLDLDAPEQVVNLFTRAVSIDPAERPENVQALLYELDRLQNERQRHRVKKLPCYLRLTVKARESILGESGDVQGTVAETFIVADLNDTCAIARFSYLEEGKRVLSETHLAFYSAEHIYHVAPDEQCEGRFAVIGARLSTPSRVEGFRENAWSPNLEFLVGTPATDSEGQAPVSYVYDGLEEFLAEQRVEQRKALQNALFDKWTSMLRMQSEMQTGSQAPINYEQLHVEGNRISFYTKDFLHRDLIDQPRLVRIDDTRAIEGIVDEIADGQLTLYCEGYFDEEEIPRRGRIELDTRLADIAIQRQRWALDAIKFERGVRPDLGKLLVSPNLIRVPDPIGPIEFFQDDLDEAKQHAVRACLGCEDIVVVEGPPGTGKTKFIAELVLQYLNKNPKSRILLSSQTHNALDNAIERLLLVGAQNDLEPNIVRIGWRTDPRISDSVKEFLLDNSVPNWLSGVRSRSETFLESWAKQRGIAKKEIEVGLAIARFRSTIKEVTERAPERDHAEASLRDLEAREKEARQNKDAGTQLQDIRDEIEVQRRDLLELETKLARARERRKKARQTLEGFGQDGKDLLSFDAQDLGDFERGYLDSSEDGRKCRELIELLEEWFERFGRSSDFHGAFVADSQILASTCVGVTGRGLQDVDFDLCIIDESSKASPTEMLVPMSRSRRWVIVGDPRQLPPFQMQGEDRRQLLEKYDLAREDMKDTLLNHLLRSVPEENHQLLTLQYRMIRPIGDLVSACFYEGRLTSVRDEDIGLDAFHALPKPVTWFSTSGIRERRQTAVRRSFNNLAEIRVIDRFLRRLNMAAKTLNRTLSVALLSGYLPQVHELRLLKAGLSTDVENLLLDCHTVDAYQGREADVVVYSVTRSNPEREIGFLREYERLNVALSRARDGLAIVGDSEFCHSIAGQNPFSDVLKYIESNPNDCVVKEEST